MTVAERADRRRGGGAARVENPREPFVVASQPWQVVSAWRLVYQVYLRQGLIGANPDRVHTHAEVLHGGTAVILEKGASAITATISSYADGPTGLPMDASCPAAMAQLRGEGRRLAEIGLLADAARPGTRSAASLLKLMRYGVFHAVHIGASDIVIGVHPHHAPFYRRMLGFEDFAAPTRCARVNDHPMVPLRMDVARQFARDPLPKGLAFFEKHALGAEVFAGRLRLGPTLFAQTPVGRRLADLLHESSQTSTGAPVVRRGRPRVHCPTAAGSLEAA